MSMHTVAVMGLGVRGKIHLHGLLENPDYYKVVGLCDIDEPKMKQLLRNTIWTMYHFLRMQKRC